MKSKRVRKGGSMHTDTNYEPDSRLSPVEDHNTENGQCKTHNCEAHHKYDTACTKWECL